MQRTGFWYRVEATVTLSGKELAALRRAAFGHYDSLCRRSASPGPDGFLHGMTIHVGMQDGSTFLNMGVPEDATTFDRSDGTTAYEAYLTRAVEALGDATFEHQMTRRQLDTLAKITEMDAQHLHIPLRQILIAVDDEARRLNEVHERVRGS